MFNVFRQKFGSNYERLRIMLALVAVILFHSSPAAGTVSGEEVRPAVSDEVSAVCQDLKPFQNLEELLYQFYINDKSKCLFNMSPAELEKIWDVKILSEDRARPAVYYPLSETEFYNRPFKSDRDAFFIEMHSRKGAGGSIRKHVIYLRITKDYFEKHGTLFPRDKIVLYNPVPDQSEPRIKALLNYLPRRCRFSMNKNDDTIPINAPIITINGPILEIKMF